MILEAKDEDGKYLKNREVRNEGWKINRELRGKVNAFIEKLMDDHDSLETGIGLITEQKRYYPQQTLAAHILGYTDRDGKGFKVPDSGGLRKQKGDRKRSASRSPFCLLLESRFARALLAM